MEDVLLAFSKRTAFIPFVKVKFLCLGYGWTCCKPFSLFSPNSPVFAFSGLFWTKEREAQRMAIL